MRKLLARVQDWLLQKGIADEIRKSELSETSVQLSFGEISYLYRGSPGPTSSEAMLLLHGEAADKSSWVGFCRFLKLGRPVLIPDLPGHGKSTLDLSMSYSIHAQVLRLVELLSTLQIKRVHVIASSTGGAIALQLAASQPELVASLVLIGIVGVQAETSWLQAYIQKSGKDPRREIRTGQDYVKMMGVRMSTPPYVPSFVLSALTRNFIARLPIHEKIMGDIAPDLDQTNSLPNIACPALIIWGRDDRVSHVSNAELLHKGLRSSQVEIIEGIGHMPMVEVPTLVAVRCLDFYASQIPGTRSTNGR